MSPPASPAPPRPLPRPAPVLWALAALCCGIEAALLASDLGLAPSGWRAAALRYGAFWPQLLGGATPLWPGQTSAMFLTHAFLHGGLWHLGGNMLALFVLGRSVAPRAGTAGFLALWVLAAVSGAAAFAAIHGGGQPMVGASGALFGLAGAWESWSFQARRRAGASLRPVWTALLGLAALNVALWAALGGLLAWEAHLGGFAAGWLWALAGGRRRS